MAETPISILDHFFEEYGVRNLVIDDYGFSSSLSSHGDFTKYRGKELAIYRLAVLLSIFEGTYLNDPDLGINLIKYIYLPMTDDVISNVKSELERKIGKYEKDLWLENVLVQKDEASKVVYFQLHLKYVPTQEDIVLDFDFIKDIQALMLRAT